MLNKIKTIKSIAVSDEMFGIFKRRIDNVVHELRKCDSSEIRDGTLCTINEINTIYGLCPVYSHKDGLSYVFKESEIDMFIRVTSMTIVNMVNAPTPIIIERLNSGDVVGMSVTRDTSTKEENLMSLSTLINVIRHIRGSKNKDIVILSLTGGMNVRSPICSKVAELFISMNL